MRGFQLRLAVVAEALAGLGVVDVVTLDVGPSKESAIPWPAYIGDAEWYRVDATRFWGPRALLGTVAPVRQAKLRRGTAMGLVTRFLSRSYDLTWCVEARGYEPLAGLVRRPVVLDLHNVHSAVARSKRDAALRSASLDAWRGLRADPAYLPGLPRRWQEWERAAASRCDAVAVCSDLDRHRLGVPNAVTIPNVYPVPDRPAGPTRVDDGAFRIGFVGLLAYQPKADAARWLADRIFPLVRREVPSAELHIIGAGSALLPDLKGRPGIALTDFVPDVAAALRRVDVVVAPIRFGGGTRFKILEAFAHRIPIVATTFGAEGIDAVNGTHLLLRDDAVSFAAAIVRLSADRLLRERLVGAAVELFERRYAWGRGLDAVRRLVEGLISSGEDARAASRARP